jgi:small subunit ribosomal protein S16
MVRIRLRRQGAKKQPTYRVVVADSRSPRDGRFIENIGFYNPRTDPPTITIKGERALYWLGQGAQPSDPVLRMLKKTGVWQEFKGIEFEPEPVTPVEEIEIEDEAPQADASDGSEEPGEQALEEAPSDDAEDG